MDMIILTLITALALSGTFGLLFAILKLWEIPSMNLFLFVMCCLCLVCAVVAIAGVIQMALL